MKKTTEKPNFKGIADAFWGSGDAGNPKAAGVFARMLKKMYAAGLERAAEIVDSEHVGNDMGLAVTMSQLAERIRREKTDG